MKKNDEFSFLLLELIICVLLLFLLVGVATWLWGAIMVGVFSLPALTYWQMWGLQILIWILIPNGRRISKGEN